jgi:HSP20 family protein
MAQEIKKQQSDVTRYRDPFAQMRAEMDRLFENFIGRGVFGSPTQWQATQLTPSIDVRENEKEIVVDAELPGMNENDVQVVVREGVLSLKGEKKSERDEKKDTYHLVERSYGSFDRSFRLPEGVNEEQIKADFNNGVLHVVVPKRPEAAKAEKKIPIGKR